MADKIETTQQGAQDILAGQKPVIGGGPGTNPIFIGGVRQPGNGTDLTRRDPNVTSEEARIGDFVVRNGVAEVVPNSITDWRQQYSRITGGQEKFEFDDPTFYNVGMNAAQIVAGAKYGGPVGAGLMAAFTLPQTMIDSQANYRRRVEARDNWRNQQVTLETFVDFDEANNKVYVNTSDLVKPSDSRVGAKLKEMEDTETDIQMTKVGDKYEMNIKVSPIFANTKTYTDMVKVLSTNLAGLTPDYPDYDQIIQKAKDWINAEKAQYEYEVVQHDYYREALPEVSDEDIRKAYMTELGGYLNEDDMGEYKVTVLRDGKEVEQTAKEVLDNFFEKDIWGRDKYLADIDERLSSDDTPPEEKALLFGELRLIHAASDNPQVKDKDGNNTSTKYRNMTEKSFWDTLFIKSTNLPIVGSMSKLIFGTDGSHLRDNPVAGVTGDLVSIFAQIYGAGKAMQGIQWVLRKVPGISHLGKWTPDTKLGAAVKQSTYGFGVDLAGDVVYDATEAGIAVMSGQADDFQKKFWDDLGKDVVIDMAVSGMGSVELKSSLARRPTGMEWAESNNLEISAAALKNDSMFESPLQRRKGIDVYGAENKLINTDEVGSKIAQKLGKIEEGNKVGKIREVLMDKNEAITAITMKAYGATQNKNLYIKGVNASASMKQSVGYELDKLNAGEYKSRTKASWENFQNAFVSKNRNGKITKAEKNYLVASEELRRYRTAFAGDTANLKTIENFYKPYIDAVPAKTRVELDKIMYAAKEWLSDVADSYVKSGVGSALELETMRDGDVFKSIGWVPLWVKKKNTHAIKSEAIEVGQTRSTGRNWTNIETLYKPEDIESPIVSSLKWGNNIAHNIAINTRNRTIIELAEAAGDIVKTNNDPTVISKKTIKNLGEIEGKYKEITEATKEKVRKQVPTQDEYLRAQNKDIKASKVDDAIEKYFAIQGRGQAKERTAALNDIQTKAADAMRRLEKRNKAFRKDGLVDIEDYILNRLTPNLAQAIRTNKSAEVSKVIADAAKEVNPYVSYEQVLSSAVEADATAFRKWLESNVRLSESQAEFKDDIVTNIMSKLAGGPDNYASGVAVRAVEQKNGGIVSYFDEQGDKHSFFIQGDIGERLSRLANDPNTLVERGWLDKMARRTANAKRILTTGVDLARVVPNLFRDMTRGIVTTGGEIFPNPKALLNDLMEAEGFSAKEIERINGSLDMVTNRVKGETLNASLEVADKFKGKELARAVVEKNAKRPVRYIWELRNDKFNVLKKPMDMVENLTRGKIAESAFTRSMYQSARSGVSLDQRIKAAMEEARFAGAEMTMNFSRKGRMIDAVSAYVPYFAQNFSSLESFKLALVNDPVGVTRRFADLSMAYMYLLADSLADDEKRKNYYNLSEYDRSHNIVISIDSDSIMTIPLDETLAGLLFYPRRFIETWNGVDPISFSEVMFGGFLEQSPFDFGGFFEGDSFNIQRGLERLAIQTTPTLVSGAGQVITGRDWYFGSDIRVTDEDLEQYGNYNPTPGDYTTTGRNSKTLRTVADLLGIPQWQLQTLVSSYGGNVGQYVVNTVDKLSGATEDEQGGKDFVEAIFKPFTGMDSQNAKTQFYNGINKLREEKQKLKGELASINEEMETATGAALVALQKKYREKKDAYGTKVGDFVNQYLQAFEITGGLPRSQAMQIYYLFDLSDDRSIYEAGSVAEYHANLADKAASKETVDSAAPWVDKYYNQTKGLIKAEDGTWHSPRLFTDKAFFNTLYGRGEKHEVSMRNILEGKDSTLKDEKSAMETKRRAAYSAKNYKEAARLELEFDKKVIDAITPYVDRYGAEEVIGDSKVLDYLASWIYPPSEFMVNNKGRYISLGNDGSKREAFAKPYLKYLYGLDTGYSNYKERKKLEKKPLNNQ